MDTFDTPSIRERARRVVPDRIRRSYAAKFAVGFLVVLVVIGAIGGVIYVQSSQELATVTESRLESNSELQGMVLSQWTGALRSEARELSDTDVVEDREDDRIDQFLEAKIGGGSLPTAVTAIHYVDDSNGQSRTYTSGNEPTPAPTGDLPWRNVALGMRGSSSTVVTDPYESPVTGRPAIAVLSPVGMDNRAVVLVVDLQTRVEALPRAGGDASTVVVDDAGTVVMSHQTGDILGQNAGSTDETAVESPAVERALGGEIGYVTMEHSGTEMAVGYAPVEGTDWAILTQEPTTTAFAIQRHISNGLLWLLVAAFAGLGLIGLTLGRGTIRSLDDLADRAAELEAGNLETDLETDREDEIGGLYAAFDSMRLSLQETIEEAETARERAVTEQERTQALVDHLEEKADDYRETMNATAEGDFTRRMDPESRSQAMREIGEAFNDMATDLEATISSVTGFAETVARSSESVTASAEEVRNAGESVSQSTQGISDGVDDQSRDLRHVSEELDDLSATIEEIASSSQDVARISRRAADRGESGRTAAGEAIEEMAEIESRAEETARAVEQLNEEMEEVGEVVELIDGIAQQTSTLALNASIEAARAGEAGQGFAVVAEEVKKLAEETREATTTIESRIDELQERAEMSASDVRRMQEGISSGSDTVEETATALDDIVDAVQDADRGIQDVDDATDEQAESTQEVVGMVESVTATSEEVNRESETVAAAAQEQAASLSEVTQNASRLTERATELNRRLSTFTVGESRDEDGVGDSTGEELTPADD